MPTKLLIIAGGSGSGKSTLAANLYHQFPDKVSVLHLDDYFKKPKPALIRSRKFHNADIPDAFRFGDLAQSIRRILCGEAIKISTKSELYHPEYDPRIRNRINQLIEPRALLVVEGILALHNQEIRNLADASIFLQIPIDRSITRRSENKPRMPEEYFSSILIPSHNKFVLPSMKFADTIIDVETLSAAEVTQRTLESLAARLIIL